jgi:phospholipase C
MGRSWLGYGVVAATVPLVLGGYAVSSFTTGCNGNGGAPDVFDDGYDPPPTPTAWDQPVTRPSDTTATQNRAACTYGRGDMPAATLGTSTPVDVDIPITNVVTLMMENRSFDHYFGHLNQYLGRTDIESAAADAGNPTLDGGSAPYTHAPHLCTLDTNHEWDGTHLEWNDGGMNGFAQQNEGWELSALPDGGDPSLASGSRSMFYYDQTDIPFAYSLAQSFAIGDHYHASVLGPTYVNRMYVWSGTSFGETANLIPDISAYPFPPLGPDGGYANVEAGILDELEERHTDWAIFGDALPTAAVVYGVGILHRFNRLLPQYRLDRDPTNPTDTSDFIDQAAAGTLPSMSFVDPDTESENSDGNDEHPPSDIQIGEQLISNVVHAVMASPQWPHIALIITWDEHGGFYDHYPPPPACVPDDIAPILNSTSYDTIPAQFNQYGVRVPVIVVSPYAKQGYVGHTTYDHTSILRFIETKFKVPALSGRDANADPLTDLFDFSAPQQLTPPVIAVPTIDPAGLQYCETTYPHPDGGVL